MPKDLIPVSKIFENTGKDLNPIIADKMYDSNDITALSDIRLKLILIINKLESDLQTLEEMQQLAIDENDLDTARRLFELKRKYMHDIKDTLLPLKDDILIEVKNLGGIKVTSNSDPAFIKLCERWAIFREWVIYKLGPEAKEKWEALMNNLDDINMSSMLTQTYEDAEYVVIIDDDELEERKEHFERAVTEILSSSKEDIFSDEEESDG